MFPAPLPGTTDSEVMRPTTLISGDLSFEAVPKEAGIDLHHKTHHGQTLLMLGHAAEHLAESRAIARDPMIKRSLDDAIHILKGLSRRVFDEFAEGVSEAGMGSSGLLLH